MVIYGGWSRYGHGGVTKLKEVLSIQVIFRFVSATVTVTVRSGIVAEEFVYVPTRPTSFTVHHRLVPLFIDLMHQTLLIGFKMVPLSILLPHCDHIVKDGRERVRTVRISRSRLRHGNGNKAKDQL